MKTTSSLTTLWTRHWHIFITIALSGMLVIYGIHLNWYGADNRWFDGLLQTYQHTKWFSMPTQDLYAFDGTGRIFSAAYPNLTIRFVTYFFGYNFWISRWVISFLSPILTVLAASWLAKWLQGPNYNKWSVLLVGFNALIIESITTDGAIPKLIAMPLMVLVLGFYLKWLEENRIIYLILFAITSFLLSNTQILTPVLMGMVLVLITLSYQRKDFHANLHKSIIAGSAYLFIWLTSSIMYLQTAFGLQKPVQDYVSGHSSLSKLDLMQGIAQMLFKFALEQWWIVAVLITLLIWVDRKVNQQPAKLIVANPKLLALTLVLILTTVLPYTHEWWGELLQANLVSNRLGPIVMLLMLVAGWTIKFNHQTINIAKIVFITAIIVLIPKLAIDQAVIKQLKPVKQLSYHTNYLERQHIWSANQTSLGMAMVSPDYLPKRVSVKTNAKIMNHQLYNTTSKQWTKPVSFRYDVSQQTKIVFNIDVKKAGIYVIPFYTYADNQYFGIITVNGYAVNNNLSKWTAPKVALNAGTNKIVINTPKYLISES